MTSDFEGFSIPDSIHYIYFPILILVKEPIFSLGMFSAKQGHYWYHVYNVFGMTRSLTGDWTRDLWRRWYTYMSYRHQCHCPGVHTHNQQPYQGLQGMRVRLGKNCTLTYMYTD